jgi:prepilin-type N-terminal cleavage/methylation domain-containing protein
MRRCRWRLSPPDRSGRGFTLLETLVVLVLSSLLVAMLTQALHLSQRMERLLSGGALDRGTVIMRRQMIRELLENAGANQQTQSASNLQWLVGTGQGLVWNRTDYSLGELATSRRWALEISRLKGRSQVILRPELDSNGGYSIASDAIPNSVHSEGAAVLMSWSGMEGEIQYMDEGGAWHAHWPVDASRQFGLPRMIRIGLAEAWGGELWVRPQVTEPQRPSRAQLDQ